MTENKATAVAYKNKAQRAERYSSKIDLETELLKGLRVIGFPNRDLRTLAIWCNPNRVRGTDRNIMDKILKILEKWEIEGKVRREINSLPYGKRELYFLN